MELEGLDFEGFDFGFSVNPDSWFDKKEKDGKYTTGESDDYREFVEKFETKKTTDDCYTPGNVYDAVAEWVRKEYNTKTARFVRPFYPGGDYKKEKYTKGCIVVDNPPFSIFSKIVRFYQQEGIKFFLFAPTLTLFSARDMQGVTYIPVGVGVTYENGARVNTSFITNMDKPKVRTAPDLYQIVKKENEKNLKKMKKELPVYSYPDYVVTAAMVARWSKYGIDFEIFENEAFRISELDAQKEKRKKIFGGGFLISDNASKRKEAAEKEAAEKEAAEKEAAEHWELSEREVAIVKSLWY